MPRVFRLAPLLLVAVMAGCHAAPKMVVWKLELMTDPTLPVAGAPTLFRSLLVTRQGAPVDGGAAVAVLSLPARPGAPLQIRLDPRGNGVYAGRGTLPRAGNWTATITVTVEQHTEIRRFPLVVRPPA